MMLPFRVRGCSNDQDKTCLTWEQMEDLAIEIRPKPTFKPVGFRTGNGSKSQAALADASDTFEPVLSPKDGDKPPR
jgi:hypothetical protein